MEKKTVPISVKASRTTGMTFAPRDASTINTFRLPPMGQINTDYLGDLLCKTEHVPSGVTLTTDAPEDNHGQGRSFSPTDPTDP